MGNVIDNSLFVDVEKFNLAVRHYTTYNLITTQRQSVWENLYAFFIKNGASCIIKNVDVEN